jgi:DNA-binding transcriptional ArsR family regulator
VAVTVVFRFDAEDVLSCRFAISPLHETIGAVRLLAQPHRQGYHAPWLRSIAPALARLDLTPLLLLMPARSYSPDFLSPPPAAPLMRFADELAAVRATDDDQVHRELSRCLTDRYRGRRPPGAGPLLDAPASTRDLLADLLDRCWQVLVRPWWPRIRDVLEADVTFRTRLLADGGLAAVLADLHPRVRWAGGALRIEITVAAQRHVGGAGLVLMPGVFVWPDVGVMLDPPWQPTIDYPARGIAALWQVPADPPEALSQLIGRTRSRLLSALSDPASTTGLGRRCDLPVSTVSEQLVVLRESGLITTRRVGRSLRHTRTPLGTELINGSPSGLLDA